MQIIDQHTKEIMEECKVRARNAGLKFDNETLEYIVTNRDMLELSPKVMIPTLYDYWVHDVEVLKEEGKYKLYPSNPYETVINSRPAISFYNDNNPDWLNVMIFYHVLGHIDFFQNNILFEHTWNDDFVGQALADKRMIANLRSEHGRWLDYILEFSRSIDNISGYFQKLSDIQFPKKLVADDRLDYYFNVFLQEQLHDDKSRVPTNVFYQELARYNNIMEKTGINGSDTLFFADVRTKFPEFQAMYEKFLEEKYTLNKEKPTDLLEFIRDNSQFLKKDANQWMKSVMSIVRNTSLYFAPQVRSKIINEGWASYWHETLFGIDERIKGHEIGFAVLNSKVTSIARIGLNPYAIGMRLIQYVEELADKGKINFQFQKITNAQEIEDYNQKTGNGRKAIFELRKNFSDFMLVNTFVTQEFVDKHDLFVVGQRFNQQNGTIEYYIKSRKAEDYKKMLIDSLYHPPVIEVNQNKTTDDTLYLEHKFEGKQLIFEFIPDVLVGIEYLWSGCSGGKAEVKLETTEIHRKKQTEGSEEKPEFEYKKVLYTVKEKKVTKSNI